VILFPILLAAAAPAAPGASPEAFLNRLYARYEKGDLRPIEAQERIYAPGLVRQMRLNARLADGEVGVIDYDPLCQCQDLAGLKARIGKVNGIGPGRAEVEVTLSFGPGSERQQVRLRLVRTPAGWRVGDVMSEAVPSLLAELQRDNRERARH
jgi:hypothetical protein